MVAKFQGDKSATLSSIKIMAHGFLNPSFRPPNPQSLAVKEFCCEICESCGGLFVKSLAAKDDNR